VILFVLLVHVGEQVNGMQLVGWIGTTEITGLQTPGWIGTWFSLFNNWETFMGQGIALLLVVGSYVLARYLRVWRPGRPSRFRRVAAVRYRPAVARGAEGASRRKCRRRAIYVRKPPVSGG
jgi:high-affinity iron transporter